MVRLVILQLCRLLATTNERLTRWARNAAGVFLAVMLAIVMGQVVCRYVIGSSLSWSEEVSKSLMVWSVFFVSPWAYRNNANVAIEALQRSFSPRFRAAVQVLVNALVLWVLAHFFWESLFFVARGKTITLASLPIEMLWVYLVMPASLATMLLVGIELLLRHAFEFMHGTPFPSPRPGEDPR